MSWWEWVLAGALAWAAVMLIGLVWLAGGTSKNLDD